MQALSNLANVAARLAQEGLYHQYHKRLVETHPQYLELVLCTVSNLSNQQREQEALKILHPVTQALKSNNDDHIKAACKTPGQWVQWNSLQLALGNTLVSCQRYIEAAQVFASIILAAFFFSSKKCGIGSQKDIVEPNQGIPGLIQQVMECYDSLMISPGKALESKNILLRNTNGVLPLVNEFGDEQQQLFNPTNQQHVNLQCHEQNLSSSSSSAMSSSSSSLNSSTSTSSYSTPTTTPTACSTNDGSETTYSEANNTSTVNGYEKAVEEVVSNALLNMAKLFQDGLNSGSPSRLIYINGRAPEPLEILALYILSMTLRACPSTANNIGILFASLSNSTLPNQTNQLAEAKRLAFEYYQTGLHLDPQHPHLYTNLGSLYRENGKTDEAALLYRQAIRYDPNFHIALANLASCLKDQGNIEQAVDFYRRAVNANRNFVEALSGLVNCQGIICDWLGRGTYNWETIGVDIEGNLQVGNSEGWLKSVAELVDDQIAQTTKWGSGVIQYVLKFDNGALFRDIEISLGGFNLDQRKQYWDIWTSWINNPDEGANVLSTIERTTRICQRRWYLDRLRGVELPEHERKSMYRRPLLPASFSVPLATTVLPFHTFTLPFTSEQVRLISEAASNRITSSTLSQGWVPDSVYPPPPPPENGVLKVGYISSDFANHPLSHLMQNVFGFHDRRNVLPICYATTSSDGSNFRKTVELGSWLFKDVSNLSNEELVDEIVNDGVHILVNLNGFTKGARNEVFAVRPCPIQLSLMGFAGPMGAGWCDYLIGDRIAIGDPSPPVYKKEKIIYMPNSFFCCDQRQSAPDSSLVRRSKGEEPLTWQANEEMRKYMRKSIFPNLPEDAILLGNFNQLYKIDPIIFCTWLRILQKVPKAYLWLLQFPKAGQNNLEKFAFKWTNGNTSIISRILFTPVVDKDLHLYRSRVLDLFLDTPECNAHTTATDVIWSGTPIITYPRYSYKLCSRVCASIVQAAFPNTQQGQQMAQELTVMSDEEYEKRVIQLSATPEGRNRLVDYRQVLFNERETGRFFDTQNYVTDLEKAYKLAWDNWVMGHHENIYV